MRVDAGTSILLSAQPHEDFHAETALEAVIQFLREHGRPKHMSFDHDPRWVGGSSGWDFPSALRRFLLCVQVEPRLCPPHQPHKNGHVERYHRSYKEECLNVHRPESLEEVKRVTEQFQQHYNEQRPHQGRACGNQPPRQAFPMLPTLPPLPRTVQADRWLWRYHHRAFARLIGSDGCVTVHHETYYISNQMSGQLVALVVDAPSASFDVMTGAQVLKRLPIKNVVRDEMPLERFVALMLEQARSEERVRLALKAQWRKGEWDPTRLRQRSGEKRRPAPLPGYREKTGLSSMIMPAHSHLSLALLLFCSLVCIFLSCLFAFACPSNLYRFDLGFDEVE